MIRDAILVGLFSWVGVLIRIGLIEAYSHTFIHGNIAGPISKNFYPNVIGCAFLGFLVSLQTKIKAWYPPLYVGLASGLCGSLTTFSGLSEDASQQLIAHNVTSFFATLFVGFGCPYWILLLGVNVAAYYFPVPLPSSAPIAMATPSNTNIQSNDVENIENTNETDYSARDVNDERSSTPSPNNHITIVTPSSTRSSQVNEDDITGVATAPESALEKRRPHDHKRFYGISVVAGIGIFLMLALLIGLRHPPSYILFSCLYAPFGALIRWYLATYNIKFPKFPVFTFLVNFVGSLLVAGFTILVSRSQNVTGSAALNGAVTGFCGSLTTTSTFLNEARILEMKYSFIYVIVSIFGTQIFLLALNGPYYWTQE